ncbi:hypothetical protein J6590_037318 [Homalodisca vitripennis]|nr:hypothetical protein J6590_037318 [Homalodisca vitripennis]
MSESVDRSPVTLPVLQVNGKITFVVWVNLTERGEAQGSKPFPTQLLQRPGAAEGRDLPEARTCQGPSHANGWVAGEGQSVQEAESFKVPRAATSGELP